MALQTITNINVDFYDKKYIMINAKQYDDSSRWITITCYNNGSLFNLSTNKHTAYIRYKKADGHGVLNSCRINTKGEVLVELTEQMLAANGICYVDLVIVNKGSAIVNIDTGDIVTVDGSAILSTMAFCINVYESAFDNSVVESSDEFNALNNALEKADANYTEVIQLSKSYAIGDANDIRENEDFDNSKYYSRLSKSYAIGDAEGVRENEDFDNSKYYQGKALESAEDANISKTNAAESANIAIDSAESASESAKIATESATNAYESAENALDSENATKNYAATAEHSMNTAINSATSASESADEAHTYYLQVEEITTGLSGAFMPMGTIEFSQLAVLLDGGKVRPGYLYNISDNFVTDISFKRGAGIEYAAGTNVYYTSENYWDCLTGTTVTGVKGDKETEYRKGNVNLTVDNIGAVASDDVATIDETTNYLKVYDNPDLTLDGIVALRADVTALEIDVNELEHGVGVIQTDIDGLENSVNTIQTDTNNFKKDTADNFNVIRTDMTTLAKKWSIKEDAATSITFTIEDETEYRFPNATEVTINAPNDITTYECWITIGSTNPTISFPATMECVGIDGREIHSNVVNTEISIKDGKYVIACVGA